MYIEVENLSQALVALSKALVEKGVDVTRRGFKCTEIPGAVLVCINNPTDRYCRVPERKWNKTLGWIESLWISRGDNILEMPAAYVKNLLNFSDDKQFMRAGYGPRIRSYGNNDYVMVGSGNNHVMRKQYANKNCCAIQSGNDKPLHTTDQLHFIIEKFKEDIDTREAVITIHDPIADDFDHSTPTTTLLKTKDTPCTRSLHFMVVDGKMNMYVDMRSNDLIWGTTAVNVFNFSLLQEYVAAMVGVPVGKYYHKVDNLHVYEDFKPLVQEIANKYKVENFPSGLWFTYEPTYKNLAEFDKLLVMLSDFEEKCRKTNNADEQQYRDLSIFANNIVDPLFRDWAHVILRYWFKKPCEFINPFLNELFNL